MAASHDKIRELLGNGLSNEVVASAVGVTPSYISQLMSQEDFSNQVVALRTQALTAATTRDRSWDTIEEKLLDKLGDVVDSGMIFKSQDLLRALVVANNAKRRGSTSAEAMVANKTVVTLNMPTQIVNIYTKNSQGEVIEVRTPDGRDQSLTTMSAATLMHNLTRSHQGHQKYEQVRRFIPTGSPEIDAT